MQILPAVEQVDKMERIANGRWKVIDGKLTVEGWHGGEVVQIDVSEHKPYFYVPYRLKGMGMDCDKRAYDTTDRVYKVEVEIPSDVVKLRTRWRRTYEADIPYVRRLIYDDAIGLSYSTLGYYDIEMDRGRIISVAVGVDDKIEAYSGDERGVLEFLFGWLRAEKIDYLTGWNVDMYDKVKVREALGRQEMGDELKVWEYIPQVDMMWKYKQRMNIARMGLDYVAKERGLEGKIEVDKSRMGELTKEELEEYNKRDVEILMELEKKDGLVGIEREMAMLGKVEVEKVSALRVIDGMIIPLANREGWVLPTVEEREKQTFEGAYVKEPRGGIYENVATYDVEALYPSIILNEEIGYEILRRVLKENIERRNRIKGQWKIERRQDLYNRQYALKIINNAMYGAMSNRYFRLYNPRYSEEVARKGRKVIKALMKYIEKNGFEVIYGDTDSCFVVVGDMEMAKILEAKINRFLKPYKVKFEKWYDKILFLGDEKRGTKKRYVGHIVYHEGKEVNKIEYTGVEAVRGDWCELAREVQKRVAEMILIENKSRAEIEEMLKDVKKRMFTGEYDEKLVISKGLGKKDYKTSLPHVRAWLRLREHGIELEGDKVEYVMRKRVGEYPVKLEDWRKDIDHEWYWKRQIKPVAERLLDVYQKKDRSLLEW